MGMQHVLSMVDIVELSNILSRIAFSRYENFNLFFSVNVSFTKMCDDPESKSAQNGQSGLEVTWDVSDRKKELGEGMWCSGRGEKHWQCFGNPSRALSMKGCLSVYLVWF